MELPELASICFHLYSRALRCGCFSARTKTTISLTYAVKSDRVDQKSLTGSRRIPAAYFPLYSPPAKIIRKKQKIPLDKSATCAIIQKLSDSATEHGGIAQLGERLNGIQEVSGSIPLISTKNLRNLRISEVFLILRHKNVAFYPVSRICLTLI